MKDAGARMEKSPLLCDIHLNPDITALNDAVYEGVQSQKQTPLFGFIY